jgi:hypothetical protein
LKNICQHGIKKKTEINSMKKANESAEGVMALMAKYNESTRNEEGM